MDKKPSHFGLHSGLPPFVSEETDREQWNRGTRVLGPSIAERITAQTNKAAQAEKKPSNLGLNSGVIPSAGSTAAGVALFRKNGLNHPLTRVPLARRELAAAKAKPKG